jgi:3-oxoacyl-[acyl-carrier protein] reductase
VLCDLREPAEQERLVAEAWAWRPIQIWVNNAGVDVLTGDAAHWPFERKLEELWRVDVAATMQLARLAGAKMKATVGHVFNVPGTLKTCPTIVNIGWDQAEHGMAGDSGELFAATKGAVMAFTRSLAKSLAPAVRVNCVAPGWIKTAWGERASSAWQERAVRESLLGRWGTPEDVARAVRFLVSPEAEFITGQVLPVNGGLRG